MASLDNMIKLQVGEMQGEADKLVVDVKEIEKSPHVRPPSVMHAPAVVAVTAGGAIASGYPPSEVVPEPDAS